MRSPPEQELLGAMTSHGPSRECYKPSRKSRGRPAEASVVPAACCSAASTVSAQGLRAELSAATASRRRRSIAWRESCRAARAWSRRKAQEGYRTTAAGKQKRNGQSRRYRERVKSRKPPADEAVGDAARVITKKFFRRLLRPPRLLRGVRASAALAVATLLLARVPACDGARLGTRAALATDTRRLSGIPRAAMCPGGGNGAAS